MTWHNRHKYIKIRHGHNTQKHQTLDSNATRYKYLLKKKNWS
jgi:hypothetical protein